MKRILFFLALLLCVSVFSQKEEDIFETLKEQDDNSQGVVKINQDARLKEIVAEKKEREMSSRRYAIKQGFRVQVFSSNEQHTAKIKAYNVEAKVKKLMPDYAVYVIYISPFWKVRIGDCLTRSSALQLKAEVRKIIPEYKETYVVRDKIRVPVLNGK